jgi:hypothetical protein
MKEVMEEPDRLLDTQPAQSEESSYPTESKNVLN